MAHVQKGLKIRTLLILKEFSAATSPMQEIASMVSSAESTGYTEHPTGRSVASQPDSCQLFWKVARLQPRH